MVTQRLLVSMGAIETNTCIVNFGSEVQPLKLRELGANPRRCTILKSFSTESNRQIERPIFGPSGRGRKANVPAYANVLSVILKWLW